MKNNSFFNRIFHRTFTQAEAEALSWRDSAAGKMFDTKTALICVVVAVCLTCSRYLQETSYLWKTLSFLGIDVLNLKTDDRLLELGWWAFVLSFFYFVVPFLFIKLVLREKLSAYGFRIKGAFNDHYLYIIMLFVMVPLVLFFSRTESFQARYPFYLVHKGEKLFPNFLIWEFMYFIQFASLEFFFRGFMLHGTKHRFGYYSVFVMTIPYCMIHFGKPMPETIAAIIAGIVLGTLSLKSRSIWLGIAIHYSVAITMDLAALWQKGILFQ
jgi:membrane protease YdiL (CAAX protease family)